MTAEDLTYIHSIVNWDSRSFKHPNGLTFVMIFDETLLAIDRSYPFNRQILEKYNIDASHPPLVNFDFDLKFTMKAGTNQSALQLSEVLSAIGYSGPRITDLKQVYMKKIMFQEPAPVYASISWLNEQFSYIANEWITMPFNNISATTSDISIIPRGIIAIKRPGVYLFNGAFTPFFMSTWFQLSVSKNSGVMTQLTAMNVDPKATDGNTHSIPFTYTLQITKAEVMANSYLACAVEVKFMAGADNTLKWDSPTNWLHITKLG